MAYGTETTAPEPIAFAPVSQRYATERGRCAEAEITLKDPTTREVSEVQISLLGPLGENYSARQAHKATLPEGSHEWWQLMATYPGSTHEQGFFATIADGKRLIELARRTTAVPAIATMIAAAGFSLSQTTERGQAIYKRNVGRHTFMLVVEDGSVWLTFERYGARSHRNLLRLATKLHGENGSIPCFWPSYLQDPAVHVMLACQMADDYETAGRTASTRKSPLKKRAA